jgi:septum formation protein
MAGLILASQSPRRKALLAQLGVTFDVKPAHVDESARKGEAPLAYVTRIARAKAQKVAAENPGCVVLAADTPVILGRRILQTPQTVDEARDMLRLQSGRRITIPTVVAAVDARGRVHVKKAVSWVKFKRLSAAEIDAHLADAPRWEGSSGAIKIENVERWATCMHGSISGIMGLPLYETALLLKTCGVL